MAWIKIISEADADSLLAKLYQGALKRAGRIFNIIRVQSQSPPALKSGLDLYLAIMHGDSALTRAQREMLAVVVSKTNGCHY